MNKSTVQLFNEFSEIISLKESLAKIYPPTRSLTETRRIRWGFADFVPDIQEWLENEAFVPIGLFKTAPVRPRVTNTPDYYCSAYYHPQERIEALIYKWVGTAGFEFVRYNVDSTITIATTDMRMLTPVITPDFYQRVGPAANPVGPDTDLELIQTMDDFWADARVMLASLRAEPIPECGCLELDSDGFLQRFEERYARLMKEVDQKIEAFLESTKPVGKRYCLFDFIPQEPIEKATRSSINRIKEYEYRKTSTALLISKINRLVEILCCKHLEFPRAVTPERYMQQGVDATRDYFFGNWWQEGELYPGLSESEKNRELSWFEPFLYGMLFMALLEQWQNVAKLCSWLTSDYEIEDTDTEEKEVLLVFKLVASSLAPEPICEADDVRAVIKKCRLKRPKLLLKIWDAIETHDQEEFEHAMEESLTLYFESVDPYIKKGHFKFCVAKFQTVLCLIALKKGLEFPTLPEKLAAALVIRETLGLEQGV
ncbi:hypothetical protein Pan241w_60430 [Gimesia alba]|uniref:Uncharacterized protein n=1 Tax=Gimesia alba TaxID=2527973 RepID=A0A517RPW9_9PLAN|nr:hypothetical protein [Gimesia alba]QDT45915.1 hypothetical protein Pan241w_60430 [Gimesia alba]